MPPMPAEMPGCVARRCLSLVTSPPRKAITTALSRCMPSRSRCSGVAGDTWGLGIVLAAAASLAIVREDFAQARAQASEALSLCQELEDPRGIAWSLEVFAGLLAAAGLADGAARLWGAAEGRLENVGGSLAPSIRWVRDRYIERARAAVGETVIRDRPNRGARNVVRTGDCVRASADSATRLNCQDMVGHPPFWCSRLPHDNFSLLLSLLLFRQTNPRISLNSQRTL